MSFKLFGYPQQAVFGKVLPKSKIYEFAKPSNAIKELFVKQVEQIIWEYKLSPETIKIPASDGVQEIQIFKVYSKVPEISQDVFRTIDEAIPTQIFYEVAFGNKLKLIAAYKRPSDVDSSKWVTGPYFESIQILDSENRVNIPIAFNLGGLYSQMLRNLMQDWGGDDDLLRNQVERLESLRAKIKEFERLKIKLSKEKQFNRKAELNSQLRVIEMQILELKNESH